MSHRLANFRVFNGGRQLEFLHLNSPIRPTFSRGAGLGFQISTVQYSLESVIPTYEAYHLVSADCYT